MTRHARRKLLKANALFLLLAGGIGFATDIAGIVAGAGPQGRILATAPHAGIGFVEAHGLVLGMGIVVTAVHALFVMLQATAAAQAPGTSRPAYFTP